jgi:predicted 3-demethylubiquinone-9 3-methyltransferase (glyoxalase superfamily)
LSWQVIPKELPDFLTSADRVRAGKATAAMMQMKKIDLETIRKAYEG